MDMDDPASSQLERPPPDEILANWSAFYNDPLLSQAQLKQAAIAGKIPDRGLRSLHWRYFFSLLPSPAAPSSSTSSNYSLLLAHARSEYAELRDRYLRSPDGGWVNDGVGTESSARAAPKAGAGTTKSDVTVNNPLGLDSSNPWSTWFADLELRRTIRQDVERTFPEIDYFRQPETQDRMVDLLFISCKLSPEIGYRQGMHELLAPLLWTVDFDSLSSATAPSDSLPHLVLSADYIEHDTWSLYSSLMKSAQTLYDHTPSVPLPVDNKASASTTSLTLAHSGGSNSNTTSSTVLVQPIVGTAIRIHDQLLKTIDHELWSKMEELGIEPQIFTIRWLRLLFSREFPLDEALTLWDGLFAEDTSLRLMEHVCIAMLLRIRDALVLADYSEFLQLLLRYPTLSDGTHRVSLLLQQAIYLRDNVSAAAGERCREQNLELGATAGANLVAGSDTEPRRRSQRQQVGHRKASSMSPAVGGGFLSGGGLVGGLAKGVYGQAEALGINKALFGAFDEIRRGVAAQQATSYDDGMSQIPSRVPWDVKPPVPAAKDYLAEIGKMRATSVAMSNAIDLCVTVLEQECVVAKPKRKGKEEDAEGADEAERPPPSGETLMALTALKHIRDVLGGQARIFDPNVLSPLNHALDDGVFPPSNHPAPSPTPQSASLPPAGLPTPPITSASTPAAAPSLPPVVAPLPAAARPMARTLSNETGVSSTSSSAPSTPPLLLGARTDKPLPSLTRTPMAPSSRPVPPWESTKLGPAASGAVKSNLPRIPPSATTSNGPIVSTTKLATPPPTTTRPPSTSSSFPSTTFSTRAPAKKKIDSIADPLGAMR